MSKEVFLQHIPAHERALFLQIDERMAQEDVIVRYDYQAATYFPNTKLKLQPLVLRLLIKNETMLVEMKLNFIDCYTDIIEKMPEHIQVMFRSIRHCSSTQKACDRSWREGNPHCGIRRPYALGDTRYYLCSYKYYFTPHMSNPDDVAYYIRIIHAEIQMAKARKKHNTSYDVAQAGEQGNEGKRVLSKVPLTEATVIGSRHISAADFRKFFQKTLGEAYEKNPIAWDVIKMSANHQGKTLGEILAECLHPPGPKGLADLLSERRFNTIAEADKAFVLAFDQAIGILGYDFGGAVHFGLDTGMTIQYGKTGTKTRRMPAQMEIGKNGIPLVMRLFLSNIDAHRQYVESAPVHIQCIFTSTVDACDDCDADCGAPQTYTIDGQLIRKCKRSTFHVNMPSMDKLVDYIGLLAEFVR